MSRFLLVVALKCADAVVQSREVTDSDTACVFTVEVAKQAELFLVLEIDRPFYGDEKFDHIYSKYTVRPYAEAATA